MWTEV